MCSPSGGTVRNTCRDVEAGARLHVGMHMCVQMYGQSHLGSSWGLPASASPRSAAPRFDGGVRGPEMTPDGAEAESPVPDPPGEVTAATPTTPADSGAGTPAAGEPSPGTPGSTPIWGAAHVPRPILCRAAAQEL